MEEKKKQENAKKKKNLDKYITLKKTAKEIFWGGQIEMTAFRVSKNNRKCYSKKKIIFPPQKTLFLGNPKKK